MKYARSILSFLALYACSSQAAFSSSFPSTYSQCADFAISMVGAVPPAQPLTLLLLPVASDAVESVTLPDGAWDATTNTASFKTVVPFAAGTQFLAVMQDKDGQGNGGVSVLYTVEQSDKADCITADTGPANLNTFLDPSPPTQCGNQSLSWTPQNPGSSGLANMGVTGYIPGGSPFSLRVASPSVPVVENGDYKNDDTWQVSVPIGQTFLFLFENYDPLTGTVRRETSALQEVIQGENADCITENSPRSTSASIKSSPQTLTAGDLELPSGSLTLDSVTPSPSSSSDATNENASTKNTSGLSQPILILIIVGSILLLLVVVPVIYLLCARRRRSKGQAQIPSSLEGGSGPGGNDRLTPWKSIDSQTPMMASNNLAPATFLPDIRTSDFELDPSQIGRVSPVPSSTEPRVLFNSSPIPSNRSGATPSPEPNKKGLFDQVLSRKKLDRSMSVASWGNKGPMEDQRSQYRPSIVQRQSNAEMSPVDSPLSPAETRRASGRTLRNPFASVTEGRESTYSEYSEYSEYESQPGSAKKSTQGIAL